MCASRKLQSAVQIALTLSPSGQKFLQLADQIRHDVAPSQAYPGVLAKTDTPLLRAIVKVLTRFSEEVISKPTRYCAGHVSRAIDGFFIASLACAILFTRTDEEEAINLCFDCLDDAIRAARNLKTADLRYCPASMFNLVTFLFKEKRYAECAKMYAQIIDIAVETEQGALASKCYRLKALTLLALDKQDSYEFTEALPRADDIICVLSSWVSLRPPSDPRVVKKYLKDGMNITKMMPYFAMHGYSKIIPKGSQLSNLFPDFDTPEDLVLFESSTIWSRFQQCRGMYITRNFKECSVRTVELLKTFPKEKIRPLEYVGLIQIYKWIIESMIASGRPDTGVYYGRQMRHVFRSFPFVVGYASMLELKCRILSSDFDEFVPPPNMEFNSGIKWDCVTALWNAMCSAVYDSEDCFRHMDFVIESRNDVIKSFAMPLYATMCRRFSVCPDLSLFEMSCGMSKESRSEFIYHSVIDQLRHKDISKFWKQNGRVSPNSVLLEQLDEAERLSQSHLIQRRRIWQLKALVLGTADHAKTADLITKSVSRTLDQHLLLTEGQARLSLSHPILALVYIDIPGLETCILGALYHSQGKPLVFRIETQNQVEEILSTLETIQKESTNVPSSLSKEEWWTAKRSLDRRMRVALERVQKILGVWQGVLTPYTYNSAQNPLVTVMLASMHADSSLKTDIETTTGLTINHYPRIAARLPLGLILGKRIHRIPFESLSIVVNAGTPITRVPSLRIIALQSRRIPVDVSVDSAFYVLNPEGDLRDTETTFRPVFNNLSWEGIVRQQPAPGIIVDAVTGRDLFVYCGHGSGNEYFDYSSLLEDGIACRAVMFLMGCRSGELIDNGDMDPCGVPYSCVAAGSCAVVANLWNVTDKDIDRFLISLMEHAVNKDPCDLAAAVSAARQACKLRYLTGAAPVVYGVSTLTHTTE